MLSLSKHEDRLLDTLLDRESRPVKPGERKASEGLGTGRTQVGQDTNRHGFPQLEPLDAIGAPMHAGSIASQGNVGRQFVQFPTDREIPSFIGHKREAVGNRDHRVGNDECFIEERFQHRRAGASNGRMTRRIGGMRGAPFRIRHRQQIRAVGAEDRTKGACLEDFLM